MADLILDEKDDAVPLGTYTNPKHESKYRNHPLFFDKTKISVRIQLYMMVWAQQIRFVVTAPYIM
jgi:hypothetical protein